MAGELLLQTWEGGSKQGWEGRTSNTCCRNADTRFLFYSCLLAISALQIVNLTTYGMVGSMSAHMTEELEKEKAGGGMFKAVMNT